MTGRPDVGNDVGIHSFKLKRDALKHSQADATSTVFGEIAIWGEVVEHEIGYRSEYGRVTGLDRPQWMSKLDYAELCERYGISVGNAVSAAPRPAPGPPVKVYGPVDDNDRVDDTVFSFALSVGICSIGGMIWSVAVGMIGPVALLAVIAAVAFRLVYRHSPFSRSTP